MWKHNKKNVLASWVGAGRSFHFIKALGGSGNAAVLIIYWDFLHKAHVHLLWCGFIGYIYIYIYFGNMSQQGKS